MSSVLAIRDYSLDYVTRGGTQRVLQDVTLAIEAGEVLGLVGESGSGKTSLAWAINAPSAGQCPRGAGRRHPSRRQPTSARIVPGIGDDPRTAHEHACSRMPSTSAPIRPCRWPTGE